MGDILVFLTGQDDIDAAIQLLNEEDQSNGKNSSGMSDQTIISWLVIFYICTSQSSCNLLKHIYSDVHICVTGVCL